MYYIDNTFAEAFTSITPQDYVNYMEHAGYM